MDDEFGVDVKFWLFYLNVIHSYLVDVVTGVNGPLLVSTKQNTNHAIINYQIII